MPPFFFFGYRVYCPWKKDRMLPVSPFCVSKYKVCYRKTECCPFFRAVFQGRLHVVEIQNAVRFTLQVWLYVEIFDLLKHSPRSRMTHES